MRRDHMDSVVRLIKIAARMRKVDYEQRGRPCSEFL